MDEPLHKIDDLFYSSLNDNKDMPSEKVWEEVDKALDKENIVNIKRKYASLKRFALALCFLLLLLVLNKFFKPVAEATSPNDPDSANTVLAKDDFSKPGGKNKKESAQKTSARTLTATAEKEIAFAHGPAKGNRYRVSNSLTVHTGIRQTGSTAGGQEKMFAKNPSSSITAKMLRHEKISDKGKMLVKIRTTLPVEDTDPFTKDDEAEADAEVISPVSQANKFRPEQQDPPGSEDPQRAITKVQEDTSSRKSPMVVQQPKSKTKKHPVSLTPFFSPDFAWYRLYDNDANNASGNSAELEKQEKHKSSFTYGVLFDYTLKKNWSLQSGITISHTNITLEPGKIFAAQDNNGDIKYRINTSSGYGYVLPAFSSNPATGDSLYTVNSIHSLQYISLPVAVTYSKPLGRLQLQAQAGVSINLLTRARLEMSINNGFLQQPEVVNKLRGLRKTYFSALAGIGTRFSLSKNISLNFSPILRFALNSINDDTPVKSYPMSFGFATGLQIKL